MSLELTTYFPWGVLLVSDSESNEEIPAWTDRSHVVAAAESALALRVRHDSEGAVTVRAVDGESEMNGTCVFVGSLLVSSGQLRISDALLEQSVVITMAPGAHGVRIYVDDPAEPTSVDMVVD